MRCSDSMASYPCVGAWIAPLLAGALAVLIGILFGFGMLPLFDAVVYALLAFGALGAVLFVASLYAPAGRAGCTALAGRTWIAGFIGTIASALSLLSFVGIAPAWLAGVLVGFLTLFTALLLIGLARFALCAADSAEN